MTLKTILFFATAIILIAAANPKASLTGKIKTIYLARWGDTLTYHYDDQGRISEVTSDRGYRCVYEYKGNIIKEKTTGGSTITMFLNSKGLVDSLVDIDSNRTSTVSLDSKGLPSVFQKSGVHRVFPYTGQHLLAFEGKDPNPNGMVFLSGKFIYDESGYLIAEKKYVGGQLQFTSRIEIENGNITSYLIKNLLTDTVTSVNPAQKKRR